MSNKYFKRSSQIGVIILGPALVLVASLALINGFGLVEAQAAASSGQNPGQLQTVGRPQAQICDCSGDVYNCENFVSQQVAQDCFDYCKNLTHSFQCTFLQ